MLQVKVETKQGVLIIHLKGELDHHTADGLRQEIEDALDRTRARHLILHAKGLTFMDSSGVGVIIGRYKRVAAAGGKIIVTGLNPLIRRIFEISGLFKILGEADTIDSAVTLLGGKAV